MKIFSFILIVATCYVESHYISTSSAAGNTSNVEISIDDDESPVPLPDVPRSATEGDHFRKVSLVHFGEFIVSFNKFRNITAKLSRNILKNNDNFMNAIHTALSSSYSRDRSLDAVMEQLVNSTDREFLMYRQLYSFIDKVADRITDNRPFESIVRSLENLKPLGNSSTGDLLEVGKSLTGQLSALLARTDQSSHSLTTAINNLDEFFSNLTSNRENLSAFFKNISSTLTRNSERIDTSHFDLISSFGRLLTDKFTPILRQLTNSSVVYFDELSKMNSRTFNFTSSSFLARDDFIRNVTLELSRNFRRLDQSRNDILTDFSRVFVDKFEPLLQRLVEAHASRSDRIVTLERGVQNFAQFLNNLTSNRESVARFFGRLSESVKGLTDATAPFLALHREFLNGLNAYPKMAPYFKIGVANYYDHNDTELRTILSDLLDNIGRSLWHNTEDLREAYVASVNVQSRQYMSFDSYFTDFLNVTKSIFDHSVTSDSNYTDFLNFVRAREEPGKKEYRRRNYSSFFPNFGALLEEALSDVMKLVVTIVEPVISEILKVARSLLPTLLGFVQYLLESVFRLIVIVVVYVDHNLRAYNYREILCVFLLVYYKTGSIIIAFCVLVPIFSSLVPIHYYDQYVTQFPQ